jgi:hypothetical protein
MLIVITFSCLMLNLLCFAVAPNVFTAVTLGITIGCFLATATLEYFRYKL